MARTAERDISHANLSMRRQVAELDVINDYMHGMLDSLDVGVVAIGADGRVTTMNHTAEKMLGVKLGAARGHLYESLPTRLAEPPQIMKPLETNEQPESARKVLKGPNGNSLFIESSISLIRDDTNRVLGAVHILKDLSPMEEMEKQLQRATRLAGIGRMASTLAHEIRNPLTAIAGFSQLLADGMDANDPQRRFAENIVSATNELNKTVKTTLLFARTPTLTMRNLNPLRLLEDIKTFVEEELRAHHDDEIEVQIETRFGLGSDHNQPATRVPNLPGDAEQLRRALLNLAQNAVDAMPNGGRLTLRLSCPPASGPEMPMIRLSVADTGTGITPEIRELLFEPFETTKNHGTGLGLAVVKKVADLHSGRISVESRLGAGTIFHLDLPAGFQICDSDSNTD